MRFTAVQHIINDERGLAIWNSWLKIQCVLPAFSMRFQLQREFDKYKNMGGRVYVQQFFVGVVIVATAPELCQNKIFFPEKEDERIFCLCSGIYAYFR